MGLRVFSRTRPSQPRTPGYNEFIFQTKLCLHLSCTRYPIGAWDDHGVRVLTNEVEEYASVHFRVPVRLPVAWATQLATFSTQRIFYTARDREWDEAGGSGPTSDRNRWSAFVDSVIAAVDFARAALETAVWAHARGEEWNWPYSPPGRVEDKYELWVTGTRTSTTRRRTTRSIGSIQECCQELPPRTTSSSDSARCVSGANSVWRSVRAARSRVSVGSNPTVTATTKARLAWKHWDMGPSSCLESCLR